MFLLAEETLQQVSLHQSGRSGSAPGTAGKEKEGKNPPPLSVGVELFPALLSLHELVSSLKTWQLL